MVMLVWHKPVAHSVMMNTHCILVATQIHNENNIALGPPKRNMLPNWVWSLQMSPAECIMRVPAGGSTYTGQPFLHRIRSPTTERGSKLADWMRGIIEAIVHRIVILLNTLLCGRFKKATTVRDSSWQPLPRVLEDVCRPSLLWCHGAQSLQRGPLLIACVIIDWQRQAHARVQSTPP